MQRGLMGSFRDVLQRPGKKEGLGTAASYPETRPAPPAKTPAGRGRNNSAWRQLGRSSDRSSVGSSVGWRRIGGLQPKISVWSRWRNAPVGYLLSEGLAVVAGRLAHNIDSAFVLELGPGPRGWKKQMTW